MEAPGKGIPVAGFDYTKDVHQKGKHGETFPLAGLKKTLPGEN